MITKTCSTLLKVNVVEEVIINIKFTFYGTLAMGIESLPYCNSRRWES